MDASAFLLLFLLYVFENFDEDRFGVLEIIDPTKNKVKASFVEEAFRNGQIQDKPARSSFEKSI